MPSSTVENYLKCIYNEQLRSGKERVSTGQIAQAMRVAPGTVTSMIKTLSESDFVSYERYTGVSLTPQGQHLATRVLRRHRVVELFLVEIMGMNWSEVHKDAEVLEHVVSDRLIERMDEMLNRPQVDPHGDPIPNAAGEVVETARPNLLSCPLETPLRLARVLDQTAEFLRLLESKGLTLGAKLQVLSRDETADTVALRSSDGAAFSLGFRAADKLLVEPAS